MKARLAALAVFALACRDIAGIEPLVYDDSGASGCGAAPAAVLHGPVQYDSIAAQAGFVYLGVGGSGLQRCATSGCGTASAVVTNLDFIDFALTQNGVEYLLSDLTAGDGSIHTAAADGSGDQTLASGLAYPSLIAVSGAKAFWVDDPYDGGDVTLDSVNCVGCQGSTSAPWITMFPGGVYAVAANATDVFAVADGDAVSSTVQLVSCSTTSACNASPKTLLTGLDLFSYPQQLAVDSTYAYVARNDHEDVVRVDGTGAVTELVMSQDVTALAVDEAAGNLYFGTSTGELERIKSDGTGSITTLACNQTNIVAIAVDDAVYFIAGETGADVLSVPK